MTWSEVRANCSWVLLLVSGPLGRHPTQVGGELLEAVCIGYKATGWMLSSLMMTLMWSGIIVCGEGGGWGWQLFCQFTPITYCYIDFNVGN